MIICGKCGTKTQPGERTSKLVLETRPRVYKDAEGYLIAQNPVRKRTKNSFTEIVKEILVCLKCSGEQTVVKA